MEAQAEFSLCWAHMSEGSFSHVICKSLGYYGKKLSEYLQSTLVISNSKGISEIFRDTSTYQICRIEEKIIRTTTFNKYICNWTLELGDILKTLWKRGASNFSSFPQYFLPVVRFSCLIRDKIFVSRKAVIRDKRGRDNQSQL